MGNQRNIVNSLLRALEKWQRVYDTHEHGDAAAMESAYEQAKIAIARARGQ